MVQFKEMEKLQVSNELLEGGIFGEMFVLEYMESLNRYVDRINAFSEKYANTRRNSKEYVNAMMLLVCEFIEDVRNGHIQYAFDEFGNLIGRHSVISSWIVKMELFNSED